MSLNSDATKDNSTYINLIIDPNAGKERVIAIDEPLAVKLDITELLIKELNGFATGSIVGYEYQVEGNYGGSTVFYDSNDIFNFAAKVELILQAAMVNEKQKSAVCELVRQAARKVVSDKSNLYLSHPMTVIEKIKE